MEPSLILCDEVVSALDVSIQAQIINLLSELKASRNLSYVFITHDLKIASYFCDRIGVMYRGVLVEEGEAKNLYKDAVHPYTKLLFAGAEHRLKTGSTEVKSVLQKEISCPFAYRCPHAKPECSQSLPEFSEVEAGHKVRCLLV